MGVIMFVDGRCVKFSKEDLDGFKVHQRTDEEVDKIHKSSTNKQAIVLIVGLILVFTCYRVANYFDSVCIYMCFMLLGFIVICSLIVYFCMNSKNKVYTESSRYIEVSIVAMLPVEHVSLGDLDYSYVSLYPVIVRDISTGYESKVYVDKQIYKTCNHGDIIRRNVV